MCIEKKMEQFNSGELRKIFRNISRILLIGLIARGKHAWQKEEGNKKRFQYCTDSLGTIVYLRALQGHSGRNLIDPSFQDNVIIQSNFFQYKYHVGCAFNLHSTTSSGIDTGEDKFWATDRQYSFCLWILWTKITRILMWSTWVYRVVHNTCTMHGKKTSHFQLIVCRKLLGWKLEKSYTKKVYMSPQPPPKISLKHEWKRELGSEHAQRSEVGQLSRSFQSNQPILSPSRER